jgi:hypothetical protein
VPASVEIIAHEYTAKRMPLFSTVSGRGETENVFKANPGKGLPKKTFKDKMTVGSGADQINLYYFGPAHTVGDAFVEFPALHVMHAGDVFARKAVPLIDGDNWRLGRAVRGDGAEGGGRREERRHHHQRPLAHADDARRDARIRGFRHDFVAHVQAAKKAGKTAAEAIKTWTAPAKYKDYAAPDAAQATAWAQVIFNETK